MSTLGLTDELLVEDASRELDMSKVSNDARFLAARFEFIVGKAISRLLFWLVGFPALLAIAAVLLDRVVRK